MEYLSVDERSSCSPCNIILIYDSLNITRLFSMRNFIADSPFLILLRRKLFAREKSVPSSFRGGGEFSVPTIDDRRFVFFFFFCSQIFDGIFPPRLGLFGVTWATFHRYSRSFSGRIFFIACKIVFVPRILDLRRRKRYFVPDLCLF